MEYGHMDLKRLLFIYMNIKYFILDIIDYLILHIMKYFIVYITEYLEYVSEIGIYTQAICYQRKIKNEKKMKICSWCYIKGWK